ncbi:hypothetical protein SAMN05216214_10216 [Atopomonas hussainii]|uniref:DUF7079 domain-containing protein n=1 Tax=Atopomonas hussainii TaxID=1429083 RepID=A0A1H7GD91_9GAMM|nr:hypothetical protein [Atopomonas hussainii]SEK34812.1 hypothetical protein SAMN05216214_10216 [Atopomonas hussainii]
MDDLLSPDEQIKIWAALSDAFLDTEVNYQHIAKQICDYPLPVLEHMFFTEVTPVCAANAFAVIPTVWAAFDEKWLAEEISKNLSKKRTVLGKIAGHIKLKFLRKYFAEEWQEIARAIEAERISRRP